MKLTMMRLYDNDDDDDSNDENDSYDDNENDMNDDDDDDDDDDPYKKVLVEVNKPNFTTSFNIKRCSILVISYAYLKL